MNIAIFTNNYTTFGAGVPFAIRTFKKIAGKKHPIKIVAPNYRGSKKEKDIIRVPSIKHPGYDGFKIPMPFYLNAKEQVRKASIDIVYVHHPFILGELGLKIAKENKLPIAFHYHTLYDRYAHYVPIEKSLAKLLIRKITASFCNQCDLIIAPSRYVRDMLVKRGIKKGLQ